MTGLNMIHEIANVYVPFNALNVRPRHNHHRQPAKPRKTPARPRLRWTAGLGAVALVAVVAIAVI